MKNQNIKRFGFTLIELLVVVLIIGILAAVAVPQYQKAVMKSRIAKVIPAVHALKAGEEMYYMSNGKYTQTGTDGSLGLDIDALQGCSATDNDGDLLVCNDFFINIVTSGKSGGLDYNILAGIGDSGFREIGYMVYLDYSAYPNRRECIAYQDNKLANDVCKSMGGTLDYTQSAATSYFRTPFNGYVLP